MTQRLCPRCRNAVSFEDESTLIFCMHCGAPQVRLSEELRERAEELLLGGEAGEASVPALNPADVVWKSAIRVAMAVTGSVALVAMVMPPLLLMAYFWAVLVPGVVLAIYAARHRTTRISAGIGARVGLICGLLLTFAFATVSVVEALIMRFGVKQGASFDALLTQRIAEARVQQVAAGGPDAAELFKLFAVPEFRAGFFFLGAAMAVAGLLVLAALGGAAAGAIRGRTAAR